ncbi:MAG TPA: RNA polymerase sigma factor [Steroidobacteraceae bacterium]
MSEDDRQLVARMRAGEQSAFEEFFGAYARRLAAFVARRSSLDPAGVEDMVQATLIKAIRNLGSFRGDAALFTWLCTIGRHELASERRKSARQPIHNSVDVEGLARDVLIEMRAPEETEPYRELEIVAHRNEVARTLNSLPERYALVLEWKYGDGFSVEEIAGMLGLTATAAQSLLARARKEFKDLWLKERS